MPQNHTICVVFCGFTPGNHVTTDGFELSSAQNHGIYEVAAQHCSVLWRSVLQCSLGLPHHPLGSADIYIYIYIFIINNYIYTIYIYIYYIVQI